MVKIIGNAVFNSITKKSNDTVSKEDKQLNLSNVTNAEYFMYNTGGDVNIEEKNRYTRQMGTITFQNKLNSTKDSSLHVQGFSNLEKGESLVEQDLQTETHIGSAPRISLSTACESLNEKKIESLKDAFKNNLREFEQSNPRQWLANNNQAPYMRSIIEETNKHIEIQESDDEKYLISLDYTLQSNTYTGDKIGSANENDIETTLFMVVDKYVKKDNEWIFEESSNANELIKIFPTKGDFYITINGKDKYIGTVEQVVNYFNNRDINGLDVSRMNFDKRFLYGLKSGNTIGEVTSLNNKYKQRQGYIFGPGVDMSNRFFKDIDLSDLNLNNADFRNTKFVNIKSGGIQGRPLLPDGYKLLNGYLFGPNVNLEKANLKDTVINNIDLRGVNLNEANLMRVKSLNIKYDENTILPDGYKIINGHLVGPNVNLEGANLEKADLSGISLYNVNAKGANFTDAILTSVNLENADLTEAILDKITTGSITGGNGNTLLKLSKDYVLYGGHIVGSNVNLDGANLTDFDFRLAKENKLKLKNITGTPILPNGYVQRGGFIVGKHMDFSNENLSYLNFSGVDLSESILTGANITFLDIHNTIMNGVVSGNIEQVPFFSNGEYRLIDGFLIGQGLNFSGARLASVDLSDLTFEKSQALNIIGVPKLADKYKLINQTIIGPEMIITGADFTFEDISEVNLQGVKSGQVLVNEKTILPEGFIIKEGYIFGKNVDLTNADLSDIDLSEAILEGVVSENVKTNENTKFPNGYGIIDGYIIGIDVNISNIDISNADLRNVDLSNLTLRGIKSKNVLTNSNTKLPAGYIFANGYLIGPEVILGKADLSNADLTGAYLKSIDLSNVIFNNTKLPEGYIFMEDNTIIGPGLILEDLDFSNLDLSQVRFNNVKSSNIKINENTILPENTIFENGHIITTGVDLRGADLSNLDIEKKIIETTAWREIIDTSNNPVKEYIYIYNLTANLNVSGIVIDKTTVLPTYPDPDPEHENTSNVGPFISDTILSSNNYLNDANFVNLYIPPLHFNNYTMKDVSFKNSSLKGYEFKNCTLENIVFENCTFDRTIIESCKLRNIRFVGCQFLRLIIYNSEENTSEFENVQFDYPNNNVIGLLIYLPDNFNIDSSTSKDGLLNAKRLDAIIQVGDDEF